MLPANKVSGDIIETFLKRQRARANTWAPLFQPLDSIRGGSHILITLERWKLWNVEIVDISMSVPKERRDFLQPRPTHSIKSGIWAPTLWLIPENPIAGGRRVIQQLRRRAVNDRMCQIMNNKLDHKREEEGWRRRSRNVCTLPAIIKLTANSWEENQATGFSSKLVPIPPQKKTVRFSFENYLECCEAK